MAEGLSGTGMDGIKEKALEKCRQEGLFEMISQHGKPVFLILSGAHNFGFPSPDSDFDIRGVYYQPTEKLLGLPQDKCGSTLSYMSPDRILDASIDELGHYLKLIASSNGNRLEWPFSKLILYQSEDFEEMKDVIFRSALSKELLSHYLQFARDMWNGKTKQEGVKKDLYSVRVYMTGITIFEDRKVCSDIREMNEKFQEEIVYQMCDAKAKGELSPSAGYDRERLNILIRRLDQRLIDAADASSLPEKPDTKTIGSYLIRFRMNKLSRMC